MNTAFRCTAALALLGLAGSAFADSWAHLGGDGLGPDAIERTTHEQYPFSATGKVDVRSIGGSVEVTVGDGSKVDFVYKRRAATEQDYGCETLHYEHTADSLSIWLERSHDHDCNNIRATDKLTVTMPRGGAVSLASIGDSVSVTGVEGLVQLSSIGDGATLSGVQQLEAKSIGDGLTLDLSRLGPAGISIRNIGDSVKLSLPEVLDARMRIRHVGDEIRGPGLRLESPDTDYEAVLGKGGPEITISNVGDSVVIRDGPSLKKAKGTEY